MLMAGASRAGAESVAYRIDQHATQVDYVARALGVIEQRGRFTDVRGTIVLDREFAQGDVDLEIDARSVDSGWNLRDDFVRGEPMLDAAHHPMIRFRSTRLAFVGDRLTGIDGMLTLRGVTRPLALMVTDLACGGQADACKARADATIRREDFGMQGFAPFVGNDVELQFVVVARRIPQTLTGR